MKGPFRYSLTAIHSLLLAFTVGCQFLPQIGSMEGETSTPSATATKAGLFLASAKLKGHTIAILGEGSDETNRSFSVMNISDRTISKIEIYFFALDSNGNTIKNTYNKNRDPLEPNLVLSDLDGEIKSGSWGEVEIPLSSLSGWEQTRFTGYKVTFTDGSTSSSRASASEYVLDGVDPETASQGLRETLRAEQK